jgi:hypothetical protein
MTLPTRHGQKMEQKTSENEREACVLQLLILQLSNHRLAKVKDSCLPKAQDHVTMHRKRGMMKLTSLETKLAGPSGFVNPITFSLDESTRCGLSWIQLTVYNTKVSFLGRQESISIELASGFRDSHRIAVLLRTDVQFSSY